MPIVTATIAAAGLASLAIVTRDKVALRNAPHDNAAQQAVLWQGDALEVRASRLGYLQVWDHRRERAGWVRAASVRTTSLQPETAPELLSVTRFLADSPGNESLGIAYAAAYLKAAPAPAIDAEPFDALGRMAERLARRASAKRADEAAAPQLEVAAFYGVAFKSYERDGAMQLCYDGEAFRRVLALPADPHMKTRAALALTRADCIDPAMPVLERQQLDLWRAEVLDRIDTGTYAQLTASEKNQLQMRRAGVWSAIAFQRARRGDDAGPAGQRAMDALAGIDKAELGDEEGRAYDEAALRVSASRWAIEPVVASAAVTTSRPHLALRAGEPGQTCVDLLPAASPTASTLKASTASVTPLASRCTWGVAWLASASVSADGRAAVLAVQPLEAWRELWVFRASAQGWTIDVLPPAPIDPDVGTLEFAGWVPGGHKLLVAREARVDARFMRSFDVLAMESLTVERQLAAPSQLPLFVKWQDAAWKRQSVSLR
jgi:hypothetical protein